jgi:chromosome segregation ATPase
MELIAGIVTGVLLVVLAIVTRRRRRNRLAVAAVSQRVRARAAELAEVYFTTDEQREAVTAAAAALTGSGTNPDTSALTGAVTALNTNAERVTARMDLARRKLAALETGGNLAAWNDLSTVHHEIGRGLDETRNGCDMVTRHTARIMHDAEQAAAALEAARDEHRDVAALVRQYEQEGNLATSLNTTLAALNQRLRTAAGQAEAAEITAELAELRTAVVNRMAHAETVRAAVVRLGVTVDRLTAGHERVLRHADPIRETFPAEGTATELAHALSTALETIAAEHRAAAQAVAAQPRDWDAITAGLDRAQTAEQVYQQTADRLTGLHQHLTDLLTSLPARIASLEHLLASATDLVTAAPGDNSAYLARLTLLGYRNAGQCSGLQAGGEGPRWEGRQARAVP